MSHVILTAALAALINAPLAEPNLPASLDLAAVRKIMVQHDGRWPPLDTAARDIVERITGDMFYNGHDPVLMLLAWTFDPQTWQQQPVINIKNAELRQELQLSAQKTVFSFEELVDHGHLRSLIDALAHIEEGRKLNPLESKVSDINGRLVSLQQVFRGQVIKTIPDPEDSVGAWRTIGATQHGVSDDATETIAAWGGLRKTFLADDGPGFAAASEKLATVLATLPAAHRPAPRLIATELRYNRLRPFRTAWIVMSVGAALATLAIAVRKKWFDAIAIAGLIAGFVAVSYGLSLRWTFAGRIPAANMYESLLFLGWGMGAFAILAVLFLRHRIVPLTASAMGALALLLADCLPLDHFVRPAAPVLMDTIWMSIHVPVIMVSYSVLALGVLFAHVQIVAMALAPGRRQFADLIDSLHYWYIHVGSILLLAGIATGSMWASSSWGRYWGWDPKEVWSLVAFLGYLTILHVRADHDRVPGWAYGVALLLGVALFAIVIPKLEPLSGGKVLALGGTAAAMAVFVLAYGQFATAAKSILCFWLIIMTYIGVNYVLGIGLHSYGFGTGAMTRYMFLIGGIDLALMAICCLLYVILRAYGIDNVLQPFQRSSRKVAQT